ncbi:MAG: hypothetical protein E7313_02575 [Clostridiales bacterium]|nr:hypothetical protein [Clostridiales bacterium]
MKNKKILLIIGSVLIIVILIIIWGYINRDEEVIMKPNEIVPEQEISDEQLRNTIISLYYINSETKEIEVENRMIDSKILLQNPYYELMKLWFSGPTNEKLTTFCTKNITINKIEIVEDCVNIDISSNFIDEYSGSTEDVLKVINCMVNTLTELTEVNCIKILINGEENIYLNNINLSEKYYRVVSDK